MNDKTGLKWYIIAIAALIMIYSALCWFGVLGSLFSILANRFVDATGTMYEKAYACNVERDSSGECVYSDERDSVDEYVCDIMSNYAGESVCSAMTDFDVRTYDMPVYLSAPVNNVYYGQVGAEQKSAVNMAFENIDAITQKLDDLWYGGVFQKKFMTNLDVWSTYLFTGEISSVQVLRGDDNWLFYSTTTDGNPIKDYEGTLALTNEDKKSILEVVENEQRLLEEKGVKYAVIVAPNKENVYSEYMPANYIHSEVSRSDILTEYLVENGIAAAEVKTDILEKKEDYLLYYQYDTHWNQLGGYIGVKNVLALYGIEIPDLDERNIIDVMLVKGEYEMVDDDLAAISGLKAFYTHTTDQIVEGTYIPDWEQYIKEQNDLKQVSIYNNPDAKRDESVLLVGDSFRSFMIPELAEVFSTVYVVHRNEYNSEMVDNYKPDYFIAEYAERYVDDIRYSLYKGE